MSHGDQKPVKKNAEGVCLKSSDQE